VEAKTRRSFFKQCAAAVAVCYGVRFKGPAVEPALTFEVIQRAIAMQVEEEEVVPLFPGTRLGWNIGGRRKLSYKRRPPEILEC